MPAFERDGVSLYYEEFGSGFPVLLFAPGSLFSSIDYWRRPSSPFDPTVALAQDFRVIAMDQRNAGKSRAPITAQDGWHTYAADHVALLDHLGIERCHLLGQCIGGPFILKLLEVAPQRVVSAVVLQPIGRIGPLAPGHSPIFEQWCASLQDHPEATPAVLDAFYRNLYAPEFVYAVSREFAASCRTPMVVLPGNDQAHPFVIGEELAKLAPNAEYIPEWKEGAAKEAAIKRLHAFLLEHTPG